METQRKFETGLDIDDPIGCFATAGDEMLLFLLREKFEGRCYGGSFVKKVERIVRRSDCDILKDSNAMRGRVCLEFEATTITYPQGWVELCKVEIVQEKAQLIIVKGENIRVSIKRDRILEGITVGMHIPIAVHECKYNMYAQEVLMTGTLYAPPLSPMILQCQPDNEPPATIYDEILAHISAEETRARVYTDAGSKTYEAFRGVLSPYHTRPKLQPHERDLDIKSLINGTPKYISRDGKLDLLLPKCVGADELPLDERISARVVCKPRSAAVMQVLMDYYIVLRACNEMVKLYSSSVDMVNKHKSLWAVYGKRKIDVVTT